MIICFVKCPDGKYHQCVIKEFIPCLLTLLPQVAVKAIKGTPFNGQKIAIVDMLKIHFGEYNAKSN